MVSGAGLEFGGIEVQLLNHSATLPYFQVNSLISAILRLHLTEHTRANFEPLLFTSKPIYCTSSIKSRLANTPLPQVLWKDQNPPRNSATVKLNCGKSLIKSGVRVRSFCYLLMVRFII